MDIIIPTKSKYGATCSGCGSCCAAEVCLIGKEAYPDIKPPCPGLMYFNSRLWCRFVVAEGMAGLEPELASAIGIGRGCCATDWN